MIHKFILIIILANQNHSTTISNLGEYDSLEACQSAASAVKQRVDNLHGGVSGESKFVCAAKH
jgi:hypothetical protein